MNPDPAATSASSGAGLRRRYAEAFTRRALWQATSAGLLVAAPAVLLVRAVWPEVLRSTLVLGTTAFAALLRAILLRRARRRLPTETQCAALVEDASRAGGLLLSADLPGAEAWPRPAVVEPPAPRYAPGIHRVLVPLGAALLAIALLLPRSLFLRTAPTPPPAGMLTLISEQEEKIDDLMTRDAITPEEAEPLREWLEQAAADPAALGSPEKLAELDRLSAELDRRAAQSGTTATQAAALAQGAGAAAPVTPQLDSLDADTRSLLESLAALDPSDPRCSTGSAADAKEALEQLLKEHREEIERMKQACKKCGSAECDGQCAGEGEGEGDLVGKGGVGKGPGSADLTYGLPSSREDATFQEHALRPSASDASLSDASLVGITVSAPDPDAPVPAATPASGAGVRSGAVSGSPRVPATLPRHQSAIQSYFGDEP